MALCSASSSPLTHFTKHLETDQQLYQDRFVLNQNGNGYQGFRSCRRQHNQEVRVIFLHTKITYRYNKQINEFSRFSASSSNLLMPDSDTLHRSLGFKLQSSSQPRDSHTSALAWTSEYGSRNLGIKNAPKLQSQLYPWEERNANNLLHQSRSSMTANEHTVQKYPTLCDLRYSRHSMANTWQYQPRVGIERGLAPLSTAGGRQKHYPSTNLEKTMKDFDWEALFASLDTTTPTVDKADDISSPAIPNGPHSDALVTNGAGYSAETATNREPDVRAENRLYSSSQHAFERGMRIVRHHDNLSLAVLEFEDACRAEPIYFDAWKMLGCVLAEVQREAEAIVAFKEALKLEPNNLEIIMRLAVSYTNEGAHDLACQCLEQWIRIKYPEIFIPILELQPTHPSHSELFDRIKEPFIEAARLSLGEENIDTDVQVGLGVLMFTAELYQMAADCFHAAIQSTEPGSEKYQTQQHLLWNRYAVCLGNIRGKEEVAIQAYETALALQPNFVKARCNLGVLYHNINQPLTGARNILEGLMWKRTAVSILGKESTKAMKGDNDEMPNTTVYDDTADMYETLTKCCNSMCRWDLAELVGPNMDLEGFRLELNKC